jgi:XrtJ-associated TM-motif-TM protein
MKAFRINLLVALAFFALPVAMHAQSGCSDSPEAPTDVLMLVGSIGMIYGSSVLTKLLRKSRKQ